MKTISLVYISLSGNTESFVTRLKDHLLSQYEGIGGPKDSYQGSVKEGHDFMKWTIPCRFFADPLEGGNGVDNGEMLRF